MISKPQPINPLEATLVLGLSGMDWLSLKQTPWEEHKFGDVVLFQKRYYLKRRDGLPINVFLTCLPQDAGIIRGDLEICAARALRSYVGCACTWDAPCKAHKPPLDIRTFRGIPDHYAATPQGLRDYLEAHCVAA